MIRSLGFMMLILLSQLSLKAQLANGSFEQCSNVPYNMGQLGFVANWDNAGSTVVSADYFRIGAGNIADLPETPMAIVSPGEGQAVVGITVCGRPGTNVREYIRTRLTSPMEVGKRYTISFMLTNGQKTTTSLSGLGVDQIGIHFSTTPDVQVGQSPIQAQPQVSIGSTFYQSSWRTLNFVFVPTQPFEYLTFGLFGDDADKQIQIMEGDDPLYAYYFIDQFQVQLASEQPLVDANEKLPKPAEGTDVSSDALYFVPNCFTPDDDGINDDFKPISTELKAWKFEVFTKWGELLFSSQNTQIGWDGTQYGLKCANGSYVWQINYDIADGSGKITSREERGIVNLLR
ncbi:MAG: gliding motility-associated C-terminal domain-containing protein [Flavobacteriales bacterium]